MLNALFSALLCLGPVVFSARAQDSGQEGALSAAEAGTALYAIDGRLLRSSGSGELRTGAGSVSWIEEGDRLSLRYFNAEGRLARVERYEGKELVAIETRSWTGATLERITREDTRAKTSVIERYNENGLLAFEDAYDGERLLYTEISVYNAEGRLLTRARDEGVRGADGSYALLIERSYADDGSIASEKRYKRGLPLFSSVWSAPGDYIEEHYDGGILFARVYFRANKKYREEIIQGGRVVRERVF